MHNQHLQVTPYKPCLTLVVSEKLKWSSLGLNSVPKHTLLVLMSAFEQTAL